LSLHFPRSRKSDPCNHVTYDNRTAKTAKILWNSGFTENFDFADIYSLVAPRYLQCQNGRLEQAPGGFPVSIAEKAMAEIKKTYEVFGKTDRAELVIHPGGHVFDVPSGTGLFDKVFRGGKRSKAP
jgi:hypothetical protein